MRALELLKSLREDDKGFGATDEDLKVFDEAIAELEALENKRKEDGKCKHKKTKTQSFCFGGYDETVYTVCKKCGKTLKVKYKE